MLGVERNPYLVGIASKEKLRDWLDSLIETLEIMSDEELMESLKRSETQPEKREFREFLEVLDIDTQ